MTYQPNEQDNEQAQPASRPHRTRLRDSVDAHEVSKLIYDGELVSCFQLL